MRRMPVFPSVEWFNAIKDIVNADPKFRHAGTIDVVFGVKVGDQIFEITFEAFECTGVRQATEADLPNMDFWLDQSFDGWKDMVENIKAHGGADLSHTLNTIDLARPEGLAQAHDGVRRDAFYRFNQSLQDYFDASAKIDTQYKATVGA
jgi:hypothetical protein